MIKIKYVMTRRGPIIFPEAITHSEFKRFGPKSAGFISLNGGSISAYGESVSLKMKSTPEDSMKLKIMFDKYLR